MARLALWGYCPAGGFYKNIGTTGHYVYFEGFGVAYVAPGQFVYNWGGGEVQELEGWENR